MTVGTSIPLNELMLLIDSFITREHYFVALTKYFKKCAQKVKFSESLKKQFLIYS